MGLINPDLFVSPAGVSVANTYIKLGEDRVTFIVDRKADGAAYSALTDMVIWRDTEAFRQGLAPLDRRSVQYPVPDASSVYALLYEGAVTSQGGQKRAALHLRRPSQIPSPTRSQRPSPSPSQRLSRRPSQRRSQ